MKTSHTYILGIIAIVSITTILADAPEPIQPKEMELEALLERSQQQLVRVQQVAKKVDQVTSVYMEEMEESIEALEQQNKQLTNEITKIKAAVDTTADDAVPFKLEPILSDTAYWEWWYCCSDDQATGRPNQRGV